MQRAGFLANVDAVDRGAILAAEVGDVGCAAFEEQAGMAARQVAGQRRRIA
jgi:hypothetical protein